MPFSSLIFIFGFLPVVLFFNYFIRAKYSNLLLVLVSLIFYSWGEQKFVWLIVFSISFNYIAGLVIDRLNTVKYKTATLIVSIALNLLILGYFKYFNFGLGQLNKVFSHFDWTQLSNPAIHLPIGISFFTFEVIAYLVDVYKGKSKVQKDPIKLALYIAVFPHLIAGPVIRYHDIETQLTNRQVRQEDFIYGIKRFVVGLAKKVLIANNVAIIADQVFNNQSALTGSNVFWIGLIAYSLQIYFDFSGYSDMAVGLGYMIGFRFIENFNYPYFAKTVQDFWRRWNISLGLWFRDYVYIPLGGSRVDTLKYARNLLIVFFLTGVWHGAGWNFIIWGLFSGVMILVEKFVLNKFFQKLPAFLSHIYLILVIMISWVFFRSPNLASAFGYLKKMFEFSYNPDFWSQFTIENRLFFILGCVLCFPLYQFLYSRIKNIKALYIPAYFIANVYLVGIFLLCSVYLITSSYNPFIYFRF